MIRSVAPEVLDVSLYGDPILHFNPDHLRQVLDQPVCRMRSATRLVDPASISLVVVPILPQIITGPDGVSQIRGSNERIEIIVQDDGEVIDEDTRTAPVRTILHHPSSRHRTGPLSGARTLPRQRRHTWLCAECR